MLGREGNSITRNGYVYVLNNPLKYTDPSGEEEDAVSKSDITNDLLGKLVINGGYMHALYEADQSLNKWYIPGYIYSASRSATYLTFYNLVKGSGPWNYKKYYSEIYGSNNTYVISGVDNALINFEAPGNINFGYTGSAAGIPKDTLLFGAGTAQIFAGTSDWGFLNTYFDDPKDQTFINVGITLYERYGLNINRDKIGRCLDWHLNSDGFYLSPGSDYWND